MNPHKPYESDDNMAHLLGQCRDILSYILGNYTAGLVPHDVLALELSTTFYLKWNETAEYLNRINIEEDLGVPRGRSNESATPRGEGVPTSPENDGANDGDVLPNDDGTVAAPTEAGVEVEVQDGGF